MYYYTVNPANVPNWAERLICGYVFDKAGSDFTKNDGGIGGVDPKPPSLTVPRIEIVDLFSKVRDDMHFYGPKNNASVNNLQNSGIYNGPVTVFYTTSIPSFMTIAMVRFFDQINNFHIFTTLQNDISEPVYNRFGYVRAETMFHIIGPEYGNIPNSTPLFRWRHGNP